MIFQSKNEFLKNIKNGKIIALDVGTKNIGIAITDEMRKIAMPSETLIRKGNKKDFPLLKELIERKKIVGVVIGLPLSFNDEENDISKFIRNFTENFLKFIEISVIYQDERLTSYQAEELMSDELGYKKIKKNVDKVAASYILESFLNL